jgi:hypothetical protein
VFINHEAELDITGVVVGTTSASAKNVMETRLGDVLYFSGLV